MLVGCGAKGEVTPADAGEATEATQVSEDGKTISVVTTISLNMIGCVRWLALIRM